MKHLYNVTLRIHDGWEYNDPKGFSEERIQIWAHNKDQAHEQALEIAKNNHCYDVTVRKKDVVRTKTKMVKKRYTVDLEYVYHTSVEVKAYSPDEAAEAANSLSTRQVFGRTKISVHDLEDGQITRIEDEDGNSFYD